MDGGMPKDKRRLSGWAAHLAGVTAVVLCIAPAADAQQHSESRRILVGGVERSYLLHRPNARPGPRPLVLVLHGGGGTGRRMEEHTGFSRLADAEGFYVLYPDGIGGHWNDGRGLADASHDDVSFIRALLDTLRREFKVDSSRVYATGISNGAMFAHRLACDLPGTFAAIGPVAGALPAALVPRCGSAAPVSVLSLQGMDDRLVPFAGGNVRAVRGAVLSAWESVGHWARRATCDSAAAPRRVDRVRDGTAILEHVYSGCGRHAVELHAITGGGHTWPGGPRVRARLIGRTTREINGTRTLWQFFERHPRP